MENKLPQIDTSWTLFLDRDGVLNKKIDDDYVRNWQQFEFLPGVKSALAICAEKFGRIVIVTNQRGVGRGLMSETDLHEIHMQLMDEVEAAGGRIDAIFYCPDITDEGSTHRKPQPGMGYDAQHLFPEIDFAKSIIVGDSGSDMAFGKNLHMFTVLIAQNPKPNADLVLPSLMRFAELL
ncbi:MAG TPA: HAD-IIIA family hydrolase [Chitinophagales bacterium]|nr:HAD-IIIA family hydrolase [Chitinophagales bacterium]